MTPSPVPPVAPAIAAQQSPMAMYASQQGMPGGAGVDMQQQQTSMGLVQSLLGNVAGELEKVAKVIVVEKPELSPILKSAVNALSMLMNEVTMAIAPDNGAATQDQAMPDSGAVSAAA